MIENPYGISIHFIDNSMVITAWLDNQTYQITTQDAYSELIPQLQKFNLHNLQWIKVLRGPGSFSSIKVVLATAQALRLALPHIKILGVTLNEIIRSIKNYESVPIVLKLNTTIWYVFETEWKIYHYSSLVNLKSCTTPHFNELNKITKAEYISWPNISEGIKNAKGSDDLSPLYLYLSSEEILNNMNK